MRPKRYPYSKPMQEKEIVKVGYESKELENFVREFFRLFPVERKVSR